MWNRRIKPTLEHVRQFIQQFDLRNASLLVASISSMLNDNDTATKIFQWFEKTYVDDDDWSGACHTIMKRIRDVNLNAWVIILLLRYFDASRFDGSATRPCSGSRWFYTILWSGVLYFPCEAESVELADEDEDEGDKYFIP